MLKSLRGYLSSTAAVHECRQCGTDVEAATQTCPTCGAEDIAHLTID